MINKTFRRSLLFALLMILSASPLWAEELTERQWSTKDGRFQVDAVFVQQKKDKVVLQRSDTGKTIELSLWRLSVDDQKYIMDVKKQGNTPEKPKEAEEEPKQEAVKEADPKPKQESMEKRGAVPLARLGTPSKEDFSSAPPDFHQKRRDAMLEIEAKGGFAVGGQIVDSNGKPLTQGTFAVSCDDVGANVFEDGWFLLLRRPTLQSANLVVSTFQHGRVELPLQIEQDKINFTRVILESSRQTRPVTLSGSVQDERGRPISRARVRLWLPNGFMMRDCLTTTTINGRYSFLGIASQPYKLRVEPQMTSSLKTEVDSPWKCRDSEASFDVQPGNDPTKLELDASPDGLTRQTSMGIETKLLLPCIIVIDTVYQPDGSTDFQKNNVWTNRYGLTDLNNEWIVMGMKTCVRISFDPAMLAKNPMGDLMLCVKDGKYAFDYRCNKGLCDLGQGDFNAVRRADPKRIQSKDFPCELNHVYLIQCQNGCFAKLVVRSIQIMDPRKNF